jgi:putative peptidoglycan lipid II flippase
MIPRALGLGVVQLNFVVTYALASLIGAGAVSALRFGWMLMQVPETVIGTAIATAAFPTLSEQAAHDSRDGLRQTLSSTLRAILALTIPAAVGLVMLGRPLTRLMFERGSFDAASTQAVVWALQFYAVGLVGHAALEVVARTFFAQQDTRTPLFVAFGAMLVNVALSLLLMRPLGHGGLALANSLAVTLEVVWLLLIARRRLGGIQGRALMASLARFVVGAGIMAVVVGLWMMLARFVDERLAGVAGAILGVAVYLAATLALGSPEIRPLLDLVLRRRTARR